MKHYVHFIVGCPGDTQNQIEKALSQTKFVGPKSNPHRVFVLVSRPTVIESIKIFPSNVYSQFRNYLLESSKKNDEIPLSIINGAHIHLFKKNTTEELAFLEEFGVESFMSTNEYSPDWDREKSPGKIKERGNKIAEKCHASALAAEKIISAIRHQLQSFTNKTPLLLPFENFDKARMQNLRDRVFSLSADGDTSQNLRQAIKDFNHYNGKYKVPKSQNNQMVYRNKKNIYFCPPGKGLHGKAVTELIWDHNPNCWVRGTLRFGAPYRPRFHYDCEHKQVSILTNLRSCHRQAYRLPKGRKHLNIAPNDHLR